jgi:hypothetical protein
MPHRWLGLRFNKSNLNAVNSVADLALSHRCKYYGN